MRLCCARILHWFCFQRQNEELNVVKREAVPQFPSIKKKANNNKQVIPDFVFVSCNCKKILSYTKYCYRHPFKKSNQLDISTLPTIC